MAETVLSGRQARTAISSSTYTVRSSVRASTGAGVSVAFNCGKKYQGEKFHLANTFYVSSLLHMVTGSKATKLPIQ